jgi:large subunit ribosomal protein L9
MKVILTKDVRGLGRAHDEVETSDGHALHFLIPRKLAKAATPGAAREAETRRAHASSRREIDAKLLEQNLASLAEVRVVVKAKANEKAHLYDAIGAKEIAQAVREQTRLEVPEEAIRLEKPMKEVGETVVPVAFGDQFGSFTLVVEAA